MNIGLIGLGYWGKNYVKTIENIPEINLTWIYKKHMNIPNEFKDKAKFTKNFFDILEDKNTPAVIISTPTETHYGITRKALELGKDVLVEKPMALSSRRALTLVDLAKKTNRILMVGHISLYNPAIIKLGEMIRGGELGDLFYLYSNRSDPGYRRKDIGIIWELTCHDIALFNYIMNDVPLSVNAKGFGFHSEMDFINATLRYRNEVIGLVYNSWMEKKKTRKAMVFGSKKIIFFDDLSKERLGGYDMVEKRNIDFFYIESRSPLEIECRHFLKCIKERTKPLTDACEGYKNIKIIEALIESVKNGEEKRIEI